MKKFIVTTTINPVTPAIEKFQRMDGWELIVVADKKTPADYTLERGTVLTPQMQEEYDKELSDAIGWNCIQRRNFGYLWAYDAGADIVATVDDDNIPLDGWGQHVDVGGSRDVELYETEALAFDPIGLTNYPHIWHRGFPLQLVPKRSYTNHAKASVTPAIQADFWNGDPDIDAVCRMVHAPQCTFDDTFFPFASNKISPFNSQNTFLHRSVLKDYFLFPGIGRMDDIWASYYVQSLGLKVVYERASVRQDRNQHDLIKDMKAEYIGYENNVALLTDLQSDPATIYKYLPDQAKKSFDLYKKHFS
jgi:hypothetical protein